MTARQERLHEVTASFHTVAEVRAAGGYAPIYQQMAAGVAADPELLAIAAAARPGQNPPSLLLGATQFLLTDRRDHPLVRFYPALTGQPAPTDNPYPALRDFVLAHRDQIIAIMATRLVQTNEPARTSYLYPALLAAQRLGGGQPLALIEIGSSAGLTLVPDRYAYDYGTGALHGDPTSPMVLSCPLRGDITPPLAGTLCRSPRSTAAHPPGRRHRSPARPPGSSSPRHDSGRVSHGCPRPLHTAGPHRFRAKTSRAVRVAVDHLGSGRTTTRRAATAPTRPARRRTDPDRRSVGPIPPHGAWLEWVSQA